MPTSKQRREASRRHLERQLQRRQEREAARRRFTLIASIVGTVVLVAAIVGTILVVGGGDDKKSADKPTVSSPATTSAAPTPTPTPSTSYKAAKGGSVTFAGVTVKGATDLAGYPVVTAKNSKGATKLQYKDLVVGKGRAATDKDTVTVQYVGTLYSNGTKFDSSWDRGSPAQFSLAEVVKGFTYGIGGTTGVPAMKVGGRRLMILPADLAYGSQANGQIPANSTLVFVVDLKSVQGAS
ncbi:MAG TPA: FKBP-type peptidyl-prolyl cis-trans isomerase [Jatrophihabitantaceae bacterium]|nr:FKBP-type peptidyl-prolyl cis-trans isomerase [Jatrophihabitantaceae bacterium]